jgi:hypothetical protein
LIYCLLIDPSSYILDVYCHNESHQPISSIVKKRQFKIIEYMVERCLYPIDKILPPQLIINSWKYETDSV